MRNSDSEALMLFAVAVASAETMSFDGTQSSPKPPATMEIRNSTPAILAYVCTDAARACAVRRSSLAIGAATIAGFLLVQRQYRAFPNQHVVGKHSTPASSRNFSCQRSGADLAAASPDAIRTSF